MQLMFNYFEIAAGPRAVDEIIFGFFKINLHLALLAAELCQFDDGFGLFMVSLCRQAFGVEPRLRIRVL